MVDHAADPVRDARELVKTLVPREAMKGLMARSNLRPALQLLGHVAALAATGAMVYAAMGTVWVWPAMFAMGVVMTHLFAPQHECAHYSAFRSRLLNEIVAWFCGLAIMVPEVHFRWEHTDHHSYTNLDGPDPQRIPTPRSWWGYLWYLSAVPYWWGSWSGIAKRSLGRLSAEEQAFLPAGARRAVVREARIMALLYLGVLAAMLAGFTAPLYYWLLPLFLGQPVMRYIRMTEHVGLPTIADPLRNTRSTAVARPWRWLAWNMNFHGEHHLMPAVPFHALPRLHALLDGRIPVRAGYRAGHAEIRRAIVHSAR